MALAALVAQELGPVLAVQELEPEPVLAGPVLAVQELEPEPAGQALLPYSTLPMIRKTSRILPSSLSTRKPTASLRRTALAIHCWLQ